MSSFVLPEITHHWNVSGTVEVEGAKRNFSVGVEAKTLELAADAVRNMYPKAILHTCFHRGAVHVRAAFTS